MRLSRVRTQGRTLLARIDDTDAVIPIANEDAGPGRDPLRELLASGVSPWDAEPVGPAVPLADVDLLAPVRAPQKILAIGLNYAEHAGEGGVELPAAPIAFVKTPNSIVGPGEAIRYAKDDSDQVDYEAELAVVVGTRARNLPVEQALDAVLGYTACNDVSARDAQFGDGQWVRGKSFDTFCPLGPWIVSAGDLADPQTLGIRCRVNGELLQDSNTSKMIFGCAELVAYLSRFMTLEPGDVIATGTPSGVGFFRAPQVFLRHGDVVEVEIDAIGTLTNPVEVG